MSESPHPRDDWLEAQLRAVPLPEGFFERLRQIPFWEEDGLDALVREVPVPEGLLRRLHRLPRTVSWSSRVYGWATAVSLFLLLGLWQLGLVVSMVGAVPDLGWSGRKSSPRFGRIGEFLEPTPLDFLPADQSPGAELAWIPSVEVESGSFRLEREPSGEGAGSFVGRRPEWSEVRWGLRPEELSLARTLVKWPMLASPVSLDWEDLWTVPLPSPRGVDPPLVPGFPWGEYRRWGVHPFVIPAAHPALAVSEVPLEVAPASFDLARMYLERGMLPPREGIRTEEFLAALDYGYPTPPSGEQMRLSMWAGPSVFRGGQFQMLQIGVQAEWLRDTDRAGTDATLVMDCSSSMQWGARWELMIQAMGLLQRHVGPKDRIHIVVFHSQAFPVAEDLTREDLPEVVELLSHQEPSGATHVAEGLRQGYALARRHGGQQGRRNRVVLLTDGLVGLDVPAQRRLESLVLAMASEGIGLDIVDLGQERLDDQPEPLLVRLAELGGGKAHRATQAKQILWGLLDSITGRAQRVAADVRLRVEFNPRAVISYRLLGHESKAIVGLKPPRLETDFYSGQSGTAMYELRLGSGPGDEVIATAELSWRDIRTGQFKKVRQKLQRHQVARSVLQSPLPLQAAMVAAQTAEVLRESPFAGWIPTVGTPKAVLEAARQLDSRLQTWPSFQQMMHLLEKATSAKPYRAGSIR